MEWIGSGKLNKTCGQLTWQERQYRENYMGLKRFRCTFVSTHRLERARCTPQGTVASHSVSVIFTLGRWRFDFHFYFQLRESVQLRESTTHNIPIATHASTHRFPPLHQPNFANIFAKVCLNDAQKHMKRYETPVSESLVHFGILVLMAVLSLHFGFMSLSVFQCEATTSVAHQCDNMRNIRSVHNS